MALSNFRVHNPHNAQISINIFKITDCEVLISQIRFICLLALHGIGSVGVVVNPLESKVVDWHNSGYPHIVDEHLHFCIL